MASPVRPRWCPRLCGANLVIPRRAAHYQNPLAVGAGALAGLVCVATLAMAGFSLASAISA